MDTFTTANIQSFSLLAFCGLVSSATLPLHAVVGPDRFSNGLHHSWSSMGNPHDTFSAANAYSLNDEPPIEVQARSGDNYQAILNILKDPDNEPRNDDRQSENEFFKRGENTDSSMDALIPEALANDLYELDNDLNADDSADHTNTQFGIQTSRDTTRFAEKRSGGDSRTYGSMTVGKRFYDKRSYDLYTRYLKQLMRFLTIRKERQRRQMGGRNDGHKRRASAIRRYDTLDILGSGLIGR